MGLKKASLCVAILLLFSVSPLFATHFRGGILSWKPEGGNSVKFVVQFSVKRSLYAGSAVDGHPAIGDIVLETIGGTALEFGDTNVTSILNMRVIAIDTIEDILTANLEIQGTTTPGEIHHTYGSSGKVLARISTCCRILEDVLNPSANYRLESQVSPASTNRCPTVNFTTNVDVAPGTILDFSIPAIDLDGDPLSFRLSTLAESGLNTFISGLAVDSTTGDVTWTVPLGQTPGPYSTQFMTADASCKVPLDMTITVTADANKVPYFTPANSVCGNTLSVPAGSTLTVPLTAKDDDVADTVTLNNSGLPAGATFDTTAGNPAIGTFTWPTDVSMLGNTAIAVFSATDGAANAIPCAVTAQVACLGITPLTLPEVVSSQPYDQFITAYGSPGPYAYELESGSLPPGLSFGSNGEISGTATALGTYHISVEATDLTTGCHSNQTYTIHVKCLFCDDFNFAAPESNWTYKGQWVEGSGTLTALNTGKKEQAIATPAFGGCSVCTFETDMISGGNLGNTLWMLAFYHDSKNYVEVIMKEGSDKFLVKQHVNGVVTAKAKASLPIYPAFSYNVKLAFDGSIFRLYVNGTQVASMAKAPGSSPNGTAGFQAKYTLAQFSKIYVY